MESMCSACCLPGLLFIICMTKCYGLVVTPTPCTGNQCDVRRNTTLLEESDDNNMDIKYGLVPIFLIGASSIIIVYITIHCLYLHCYAKRKMQHMASQHRGGTTTILLNDGQTSANVQAVTPVVKYEAPYGKTEVMKTTPFLVEEQIKEPPPLNSTKRASLKQLFSNKSSKRNSLQCQESVKELSPRAGTKASICFVPMGKTIEDPSGSSLNWTMLQGFVYSHIQLQSNGTYTIPCTEHTTVENGDCPINIEPGTVYTPADDMPLSECEDTNFVRQSYNGHILSQDNIQVVSLSSPSREDNEFDQVDDDKEVSDSASDSVNCHQSISIKLAADVHQDDA